MMDDRLSSDRLLRLPSWFTGRTSAPRASNVRTGFILCVSIAASLLTAACGESDTAGKEPPSSVPVPVAVIKAAERPTNPGLSFIGRVEAVQKVDLVARVQGFLTKRAYSEGAMVKANDLLFVIQQNAYQAELNAALANLAKAEADEWNAIKQADRARSLIKQNFVSESILDDRIAAEKEAQAAVEQARSAVEQAQINFGYTEIKAPFDGRVGRASVSVGALVGPSSGTLATIVSQDPIYVTFPVSDRTVLQVTEGDRAKSTESVAVHLFLSTGAEYPETGTIDYTGVKVDPNTDTLTLRAVFPNPRGALIDGQFARVFAQSKDPVEALVIPQKAVLTDQGGNFVMLVEDGKAVQRRITTGANFGADVVVREGLKAGDEVIVDGLQRVRPGVAVDPAPASES
ncbi:efflux RND transporter periplasmic adaptor subunit [Hansschlegelia beijingensis]|uniref:Membrane fusion protein (Multidrug efflux system) n=1 Tax=Hansschlegelia beijingensis TaxID=1133344 RepID=A0A7W6CX04_9HYPH|nr:efflux RND transporter periplasmic adaptor subunit [Hansschlegelia beijingensis]MBB3972685.1 membrane fusion protein (multidrug efflux system) [Hansschlegelia beijingensis]